MNANSGKVRSTIYIVAGAYLAYLAVSLGKGLPTSGKDHTLSLVFAIVFGIAALVLVIYGIINFQKNSVEVSDDAGIYAENEETAIVENEIEAVTDNDGQEMQTQEMHTEESRAEEIHTEEK